jgi:hydrogenase maturation factor
MVKRGWKTGKPDPEKLKRIVEKIHSPLGKGILVGPSYGEDSAVVVRGEDAWVISSDPITFASKDQGYYLVHVNANDVATMGARPLYLILVMLLPEGRTEEDLVNSLLDQVRTAADSLGISVIGGHTEVTPGLKETILVGTMIGITKRDRIVRSSGAEPGDLLILTKGIAIEGTSIIARERESTVEEIFGKEKTERLKEWIKDPGISVVREALLLAESKLVKAMHDPTEGGLAMGIHELAAASGVGVEIIYEEIPIFEETMTLTERFELDPLGMIASGSLLAAIEKSKLEGAIKLLKGKGIEVSVIGEVMEREFGVKLRKSGELADLPQFPQDEILKI